MKFRKIVIRTSVSLLALSLAASLALPLFFQADIKERAEGVRPERVALVLGARAISDTEPGAVFKERLEAAFSLYQSGQAEVVLVSGDHGRRSYDEVNAARVYLLSLGMAPEDIFLDHAGFDTYDSLYRARDVFSLESLIIVSNRFHLPRALLISEALGLEAQGYVAPWPYHGQDGPIVREVGARIKAFIDILSSASPRFLGESIDIWGSGLQTWDILPQ